MSLISGILGAASAVWNAPSEAQAQSNSRSELPKVPLKKIADTLYNWTIENVTTELKKPKTREALKVYFTELFQSLKDLYKSDPEVAPKTSSGVAISFIVDQYVKAIKTENIEASISELNQLNLSESEYAFQVRKITEKYNNEFEKTYKKLLNSYKIPF